MDTFGQKIDENAPIKIEVIDPVLKDKSHVVYTLRGRDSNGEIEIQRRFNDFFFLRNVLTSIWPGCYIPPIPSKQAFGNTEGDVIEDRKRFFQYFIDKLTEIKYLYYCDETQTFIRKPGDYEKQMALFQKYKPSDIYDRYRTTFSHLDKKEISTELIFKIGGFHSFLKSAQANLEQMKKSAVELSDVKKKYNQQFGFLTTNLLPDYEKNLINEYSGQKEQCLIFSNDFKIKQHLEQLLQQSPPNTLKNVLDLIKIEFKEIQAFIQTLEIKEQYEQCRAKSINKLKDLQDELSKVSAGKTTLKSFFSSGSQEEKKLKLEKQIQEVESEGNYYSKLVDIMQLIIGYDEIDQFKASKARRYFEIMNKLATEEMEINQLNVKVANQALVN